MSESSAYNVAKTYNYYASAQLNNNMAHALDPSTSSIVLLWAILDETQVLSN